MMKSLLFFAAGAAAGLLLGSRCEHHDAQIAPGADTVTIVVRDTLRTVDPASIASLPLPYRRISLPLWRETADSAAADSVNVALPIERRVYADSSYRAVVSGAMVSLDTIEIYRPLTITRITPAADRRRWTLGPSIGLSFDGRRLSPTVGLSLTYRLIAF